MSPRKCDAQKSYILDLELHSPVSLAKRKNVVSHEFVVKSEARIPAPVITLRGYLAGHCPDAFCMWVYAEYPNVQCSHQVVSMVKRIYNTFSFGKSRRRRLQRIRGSPTSNRRVVLRYRGCRRPSLRPCGARQLPPRAVCE